MKRVLQLGGREHPGSTNLVVANDARLILAASALSAATILGITLLRWKPGRFHYQSFLGLHSVHLALLAALFTAVTCASAYVFYDLVLARYPVSDVSDARILKARSVQNFVQQDRSSSSLLQFGDNFHNLLTGDHTDPLAKAVAIRHWVRQQQRQDGQMWTRPVRINHDDPYRLLEEQRKGVPGGCRRFSFILLAALLSAGFDARIVCFTSSLNRRRGVSHSGVEFWSDELKQWVFLDPTFDTLALIEGKPASALELHEAVAEQSLILFERHGSPLTPIPTLEAYRNYCGHLFIRLSNRIFDDTSVGISRSGVHFLHYSSHSAYPSRRKKLARIVGACGLGLSTVFWLCAILSVIAE